MLKIELHEMLLQAPSHPLCELSFVFLFFLQQFPFSVCADCFFEQHDFSAFVPHANAWLGVIKKPNTTSNKM